MPNSYHQQSGFTQVFLILVIVVLVAAIGYSVSQVNRPTVQISKADDGDVQFMDSVNFGSLIQGGVDAIQNVINTQTNEANQVLSDPGSSDSQKQQAQATIDQRQKDQAALNETFGQVKNDAKGNPDYSERTTKIKEQWNNVLTEQNQPTLPADFTPNITNPPIVSHGTSDLEQYQQSHPNTNPAGAQAEGAAAGAIK